MIKHRSVKKNLYLHLERYSRRKLTLSSRRPIVLFINQLMRTGKKLQRQDRYDKIQVYNNTKFQSRSFRIRGT